MPPDEPNEEEALEELPEDNGTPARIADDGRDDLSDPNLTRGIKDKRSGRVHPLFDTDREFQELYDEGDDITEPNAGNAVEGYDPDKDQRRRARR